VQRVFSQELYDQVSHAWHAALTGATPPFQGDLENPTYLKITTCMREFKPENFPAPEKEEAA